MIVLKFLGKEVRIGKLYENINGGITKEFKGTFALKPHNELVEYKEISFYDMAEIIQLADSREKLEIFYEYLTDFSKVYTDEGVYHFTKVFKS